MSQHWCSSRFHNFIREWKCSPVSIWTPVKVHSELHPLSITHYMCHHTFMCRWNGDESQIRQHGFSPRGEPTCACLQFLIILWRKCLISVSKTVWKKKREGQLNAWMQPRRLTGCASCWNESISFSKSFFFLSPCDENQPQISAIHDSHLLAAPGGLNPVRVYSFTHSNTV